MAETSLNTSASLAESIHPDASIGPTTLAVADAERSLRLYGDVLGFQPLHAIESAVTLGAGGTPLLTLLALPGLKPKPRRTTGLYHVAILLPDRVHLGHMLHRLIEAQVPIGAADHIVSEALYLDDPDGNGLEIYRDRPRSTWAWFDRQVRMSTDPLDFEGILREMEQSGVPWTGMPPGTRIGHIHLQVADLDEAHAFYHGALGFAVTQRAYPGALFLSAGGYHHHLGLNIWNSYRAPLPPPDAAGLRSFAVQLPHDDALSQVRKRVESAGLSLRQESGAWLVDDPWRNTVKLMVAPDHTPVTAVTGRPAEAGG